MHPIMHPIMYLDCYKVSFTFLSYLDEGITSHVLDSIVCFVHELEQLVHNRFEELPVLP